MKLEYFNNNLVVYLKKEKIENIDFKNIDELEEYFKDLFIKIKQVVDIELTGFYKINIYLDKHYGAVLEIKREDLEYIDYYDSGIDMRIYVHETIFLYKINDYFDVKELLKKAKIHLYKKSWYLEIENDLDAIEMAKLLEISEIIYKTEDIINFSKKINKI